MRYLTTAMMTSLSLAAGASAGLLVQVEIRGQVQFNDATALPLSLVGAGSDATITFTVDASDFVDDGSGMARGYVIDTGSFLFQMGSQTPSAQSPLPVGVVPYFVLHNGAGGDGFHLGTSTGSANGVPLNVTGTQGQYVGGFSAAYAASTLDGLDIVQAVGLYDVFGLANFTFGVDDGATEVIGIEYEELTISIVPAPSAAMLAGLGLLATARRRR